MPLSASVIVTGPMSRHGAYLIASDFSLAICSIFASALIAHGLQLCFHLFLDLCQLTLQLLDLGLHCPVHLLTMNYIPYNRKGTIGQTPR